MTAPLDGLLVADFSRVLAGPLATMTLADCRALRAAPAGRAQRSRPGLAGAPGLRAAAASVRFELRELNP